MTRLNDEQWKEVKTAFDASLMKHGMGNGYIILCQPDNENDFTKTEVKVKIDGLVLAPHRVAIIGKLAERAASHYNALLVG